MSEEGCEIRYRITEEKQKAFSNAVQTYCESEKSEADASKFKRDLDRLALDTTYVLSYPLYDCGFKSVGNSQFIMYFCSTGLYWDDVILPLIHQLGGKEIFAYVHDSSWGGDIFARYNSGKTEYLYMSERDKKLDSFLYDEYGHYIGTTFDQLFRMYSEGKLFPIDFDQTDRKSGPVSRNMDLKTGGLFKNIPWQYIMIFLISLSYLIWMVFLK